MVAGQCIDMVRSQARGWEEAAVLSERQQQAVDVISEHCAHRPLPQHVRVRPVVVHLECALFEKHQYAGNKHSTAASTSKGVLVSALWCAHGSCWKRRLLPVRQLKAGMTQLAPPAGGSGAKDSRMWSCKTPLPLYIWRTWSCVVCCVVEESWAYKRCRQERSTVLQ